MEDQSSDENALSDNSLEKLNENLLSEPCDSETSVSQEFANELLRTSDSLKEEFQTGIKEELALDFNRFSEISDLTSDIFEDDPCRFSEDISNGNSELADLETSKEIASLEYTGKEENENSHLCIPSFSVSEEKVKDKSSIENELLNLFSNQSILTEVVSESELLSFALNQASENDSGFAATIDCECVEVQVLSKSIPKSEEKSESNKKLEHSNVMPEESTTLRLASQSANTSPSNTKMYSFPSSEFEKQQEATCSESELKETITNVSSFASNVFENVTSECKLDDTVIQSEKELLSKNKLPDIMKNLYRFDSVASSASQKFFKNCDNVRKLQEDLTDADIAVEVRNDDDVLLEEDEVSTSSSELNNKLPNGLTETAILKLHPIHQKLQSEMISLQQKCKYQAEEITRLHSENQKLLREACDKNTTTTAEIYEVQMEALEKTITQLQREVESHQEKLVTHDEVAKKTVAQLKLELEGKLEKANKMYENANKDKETMVIKYAQSEKEVLTLKKVRDDLERKIKELTRERDALYSKIRGLSNERTRVCQNLDMKCSELNIAVREIEKLKEELNSRDIKIKWGQNKLKTEVEAHKETQSKLEHLEKKLKQTREEAEQIRRDCQEMIKTYQESEEIKSNSLDLQLKEKETELELERQEKSDQEEVYQMVRHELEALKKKHKLSIEETNNLTVKVQTLERERLDYENNLSKLKETVNSHKQEINDLNAALAEMENLRAMLAREKEKELTRQNEIEHLRQSNSELQMDMDSCRSREGELLEFTERLTAKNVTLQSEYASMEAKHQLLTLDHNSLLKRSEELEKHNVTISSQLNEEKSLRQQETQLLARKLAEKTKLVESLNIKLDEEINENRVMKRRHISSVKELTRELQQLKKKLEASENSASGNPETLSIASRASSSNSLDMLASNSNLNSSSVSSQVAPVIQYRAVTETLDNSQTYVATIEPDRQLLIERIVKLQRAHARKNEKIEFLEEHVSQLLEELKKKKRIIQAYIMKEEAGILATDKMDQNKRELSRRGGIMASVYSSHAYDDAMTLELSLEINHKLQAVLEDTLLKNITLKENINTLGDEIARITKEYQLLQKKSQVPN